MSHAVWRRTGASPRHGHGLRCQDEPHGATQGQAATQPCLSCFLRSTGFLLPGHDCARVHACAPMNEQPSPGPRAPCSRARDSMWCVVFTGCGRIAAGQWQVVEGKGETSPPGFFPWDGKMWKLLVRIRDPPGFSVGWEDGSYLH